MVSKDPAGCNEQGNDASTPSAARNSMPLIRVDEVIRGLTEADRTTQPSKSYGNYNQPNRQL